MTEPRFLPRRTILKTGLKVLGAAAVTPLLDQNWPGGKALAQAASGNSAAELRLGPTPLALQDGIPPTPVWALKESSSAAVLRVAAGDWRTTLINETTAAAAFEVRGLDGNPQAHVPPQKAVRRDANVALSMTLDQPGTFLLDPRLLGDGNDVPIVPQVLVVDGGDSFNADRDEVLLIEDWKLGADGKPLRAGSDASDLPSTYTVNRKPDYTLGVKPNERVRLRLVNGCKRLVMAVKFADHDVNVVAIDSKPAEPFAARDGQIILGPGARVDALLDAVRPAGSTSGILLHDGVKAMPIGQVMTNGAAVRASPLPTPPPPAPSRSNIDLKSAQRIDLSLDPAQWIKAAAFDGAAAPAFRTKKNRTVVLTVTNAKSAAATLHLQGHHVRLLDRLDDGWKPFWLDTLIFQPGQTQRVAFNAEHGGSWLLECVTTAWSSPRMLRSYVVE